MKLPCKVNLGNVNQGQNPVHLKSITSELCDLCMLNFYYNNNYDNNKNDNAQITIETLHSLHLLDNNNVTVTVFGQTKFQNIGEIM